MPKATDTATPPATPTPTAAAVEAPWSNPTRKLFDAKFDPLEGEKPKACVMNPWAFNALAAEAKQCGATFDADKGVITYRDVTITVGLPSGKAGEFAIEFK